LIAREPFWGNAISVVTVMLGVMLARLAGMMSCMRRVAMRGVGVVCGFLVRVGIVVLGGFAMMLGGVLVMVGGGIVMFDDLVLGHDALRLGDRSADDRRRGAGL
jgi:hypothetical protein